MPARTRSTRKSKPKARPAAGSAATMTRTELLGRLAEVARVGSMFIEGEDCVNLFTPASRTWTKADDINYDARVALPLKKTLLRIERIERFPYYAILWRRRPDMPDRVEILLAGRMNSALDQGKGTCPLIFPQLRTVFEKGRAASLTLSDSKFEEAAGFRYGHVWLARNDSLLRAGKRIVSHFSPIRDSREQIVAALELTCVGSDN